MTRGGGSPTLLMVEHELCSSCNLYSGTHLLCPQLMCDEAHVHCPCAFKHLLCLHISTGTCSPLRGAGPVSPMSLLLPSLHPNALSCTCATVPTVQIYRPIAGAAERVTGAGVRAPGGAPESPPVSHSHQVGRGDT